MIRNFNESNIFYEFRYVRNFRFDMHVLTIYPPSQNLAKTSSTLPLEFQTVCIYVFQFRRFGMSPRSALSPVIDVCRFFRHLWSSCRRKWPMKTFWTKEAAKSSSPTTTTIAAKIMTIYWVNSKIGWTFISPKMFRKTFLMLKYVQKLSIAIQTFFRTKYWRLWWDRLAIVLSKVWLPLKTYCIK